MRIGLIDLGTNSIRFDVHEISSRGEAIRLLREKELVRLGETVFTTHRVSDDAAKRTLEAFRKFRKIAEELEVEQIVAVGTSALRDATNSQSILRQVEKETGIEVQIISGEEEAELIARGVLKNEKNLENPVAIVDIGGGSTEIIVCKDEVVYHSTSFNLGTLRLQQVYLKTHPPTTGDRSALPELRHQIRTSLSATIVREGWPEIKRLIGASGTIRALQRMGKKAGDKNGSLERETLDKLIRRMSGMNLSELKEVPGMEDKRVDIILAGAVLLEEIADVFRMKKIYTSEYSLRDGLLDREVSKLRNILR